MQLDVIYIMNTLSVLMAPIITIQSFFKITFNILKLEKSYIISLKYWVY